MPAWSVYSTNITSGSTSCCLSSVYRCSFHGMPPDSKHRLPCQQRLLHSIPSGEPTMHQLIQHGSELFPS